MICRATIRRKPRESTMDHPHNREQRQAAASEFDLIRRHFQHPERSARRDVVAGVGDDAALLEPPPGMELAATVDTLLAGVHYPESTAPEDVGHKALAVNLSDLAAMGAAPAWATLALTLPAADEAWLHGFSTGLFSLAEEYGVALVGGDTTRGPMTAVTLQLLGLVPKGEALRRGGAKAGDRIHVTGTLGDAALALRLLQRGAPVPAPLRRRLDRPEPRVAQGAALRGVASSCIDISAISWRRVGWAPRWSWSGSPSPNPTGPTPRGWMIPMHRPSPGGTTMSSVSPCRRNEWRSWSGASRGRGGPATASVSWKSVRGCAAGSRTGGNTTPPAEDTTISPGAERPVPARLLRNPLHLLSLGFGSGLAPVAPGTFGTLAAVPLYLLLQPLSLTLYLLLVAVMLAAGVGLCAYTSRALGVHWKPWPIGTVDRRLSGGLGIMFDDLLAGFYALLVMQSAALLLPM